MTSPIVHSALQAVLSDLLAGFSATVLAYGLTGTCKTTLLFGSSLHPLCESCHTPPFLLRILHGIFDQVGGDALVSVSASEVLCGEVRDLLHPRNAQEAARN